MWSDICTFTSPPTVQTFHVGDIILTVSCRPATTKEEEMLEDFPTASCIRIAVSPISIFISISIGDVTGNVAHGHVLPSGLDSFRIFPFPSPFLPLSFPYLFRF
jgi:hypothetical protein